MILRISLAIACFVLAGCMPSSANEDVSAAEVSSVTALGRIDSYDRARYLSPRRGGVLEELTVQVGDIVEAGQLLATLECSRERTRVQVLKAAFENAQVEYIQIQSGARAGERENCLTKIMVPGSK